MSIKGVGNNPYSKLSQDSTINKAQEANVDKSNSATTSNVGRKGDEVKFSGDSKLMAEAYRTAMKTDDVRLEKVAEIKAKIAAGTYEIDNAKIAKNILQSESDLLK